MKKYYIVTYVCYDYHRFERVIGATSKKSQIGDVIKSSKLILGDDLLVIWYKEQSEIENDFNWDHKEHIWVKTFEI